MNARTNGAARAAQALTAAQQRGLLAMAGGNVRVRSDVVDKLRALGLVNDHRRPTDAGRLVADELRVAMRQPERPSARPVDVVEALATVDHRRAPEGVPGAVARMLFDLPGDAERVGALAWLASPAGAAYLGSIKDAFIVAARRGRTYEQAAEHLGVSVKAVNKAVVRSHGRRQYEVDTPTPTEG